MWKVDGILEIFNGKITGKGKWNIQDVYACKYCKISVKKNEVIDSKHDVYYSNAVNVATENEIPVVKPRICMIKVNRENYYVESVSDYYKVCLTIPFLDKLIVDEWKIHTEEYCHIFRFSYSSRSNVEKYAMASTLSKTLFENYNQFGQHKVVGVDISV